MAPTLTDFNKKPVNFKQLRMSAFQPTVAPSPAANQDTINMLGTYGAALSSEDMETNFQNITNQLSYSTSSTTLERILSDWRQNDVQGSMDTLRSVMVDPSIPDAQKQEILYNFQTGQAANRISYNVTRSALMADDEGETSEQENLRVLISQSMDEVDSYNAWSQNQLNVLNSSIDASFTDSVANVVNSILPFVDAADQAFFESLLNVEGTGGATNTAQTLLLLGEGKERVRKAFANIPIDQRQGVVTKIIETIKMTSGMAGGDQIALKQIAALEDMITPGAYNNTDRWVDNVFSVLDDTIILSPISRLIKGARAGLSAADDARVADQIIARGERVSEVPTASPAPLMIEYKPTGVDWSTDVDNIIDNLPVEPTNGNITQLRDLINRQMDNANFSIDDVIEEARITDDLTSTQVDELRGAIGSIRDKRTTYMNSSVPQVPATVAEVRASLVSSNVSPKALSQLYRNTNNSKAIAAHETMLADSSDNAARLLYGTTRQNAIAHDFGPEIGGHGRVKNKVEFDESSPIPDQKILEHVRKSKSSSYADEAEKAGVQAAVIPDWKSGLGLSNRSAMAQISDLGIESVDTGVRINQVYGPKKGGFSNAYTAIDIARANFAKYGVLDEEITILSRQKDGHYAPAQEGLDFSNGNFLVQIKHDYKFDPKDVDFQGFDVSKIWGFLRAPDIKLANKEGGVVQQLLPKSVNIDARAYTPGVAAADKAAGIHRQLMSRVNEFGKRYNALPKNQQAKIDDYIRKANEEQLEFKLSRIRGLGVSEDGVEVLARGKQIQDTLGELENMDVARTLRSQDYKMFEHRASNTRMIVKDVPKSTAGLNKAEIYDVTTDSFVILSNKNIDDLYEQGGSIVQLKTPEEINGRSFDYLLSPNNGGAYSRKIRDNDRILNYRHGYYHVRYTDPYYITKTVNGKTSVIARAEGIRDADLEARRLNETQDGAKYAVKRDKNEEAFDNHLEVAINTGRSAQRMRGERLQKVGASGDKTISDLGVESPADSLLRSISSISNRTAFRDVIDAEKRRWMSQFQDLISVTPEKGKVFPNSVDDILNRPGATEARHAYRHIEHLQDGYGNKIDDMTKAFLSGASELAGRKGWGWAEKQLGAASKKSPSGFARLTAFNLFLASNPMRQLPLQALPAIPIISSLNPLGWGRVLKESALLGSYLANADAIAVNKLVKYGLKPDEIKALVEDFELSGIAAAVNAHSFKSDSLGRLADRTVMQKAGSVAMAPLNFTRKIGFDLGEQTLMTLVWVSERNRYMRKTGKTKLSPDDRDIVVGKARALTGDMNRGGEMPYNSNSLSVLMQFMQTPHKIASSLILGHKSLSGAERLKLATGYTLAFGVPGVPIIEWFVDKMLPPGEPELRDVVKGGLTNILVNNFLSSISGEKTRIDFSTALQPFSLEPMIEMMGDLGTMNFSEFVQGTAAVSLVAPGGRITNFASALWDWARPGNFENVDEAKQAGLTLLQMFSGSSNAFKAWMIGQTGKITTSTGQVVDEDPTYWETMLKAANFQTMDEYYYWEGIMTKREIDGKIQSDIENVVDDLFTKLTREGFDVNSFEQYVSMLRIIGSKWNENPAIMEKVADYMKFKMRQDPDGLARLMRRNGLYSDDEVIRILNNSNISVEEQNAILEIRKVIGESYGD